MAFCGVGVGVFFGEVFDFENRMLFDIFLDLGCSMIGCLVDEENYSLEVVSFGVCDDVVQVFSELDVPST